MSLRLLGLTALAALGLAAAIPSARAQQSLYVSNAGGNTITKFTGGVPSTFASSGLDNPYGLAFDQAGNLYVANNGNINQQSSSFSVERLTPGGQASVFASAGLSEPYGLAFDASGNLYAANFGSSTIEKFTPDGKTATQFASTGLTNPSGLAFDSSGNLYAANFGNGTVEAFTPAGVGSVFASGLNRPNFLAFGPAAPNGGAPVPEASTTVSLGLMLTLGAGGLAFTARKRRRANA